MGRETRGSGSLTRVAIDTAATNGAKDARMSCAISMLCVQAAAAGAQHETDAHADSVWFIRFASDLRLCTLRCGGRARVQSHHWRCDERGLQRCTRTDLSEATPFFRFCPPWGVELLARAQPSTAFVAAERVGGMVARAGVDITREREKNFRECPLLHLSRALATHPLMFFTRG